ncbi:hypothetical protein [Nocardia sp. NPDC005825]|uniref:hypothetical protein n=1 Tax=unclassified Nocardia TaxID=2637762 RepID=UPI0033C53707
MPAMRAVIHAVVVCAVILVPRVILVRAMVVGLAHRHRMPGVRVGHISGRLVAMVFAVLTG